MIWIIILPLNLFYVIAQLLVGLLLLALCGIWRGGAALVRALQRLEQRLPRQQLPH